MALNRELKVQQKWRLYSSW